MDATIPTNEMLDMPARRAARLIALAKTDAVTATREELGNDNASPQALKDFRVALRRLRSWLRAYRPYLDDTLHTKTRARLRRLARATNQARDLEVQLAWLDAEIPLLPRRNRAGTAWIARHLRAEYDRAVRHADDVIAREAERVQRALTSELDHYHVTYRLDRPEVEVPMREVMAELIRAGGAALRKRLSRVEPEDLLATAHRARIAGKQLRYLMEPLEEIVPDAKDTVKQLAALQDTIGDLRDAWLFADRILNEVETAAAERARIIADAVIDGDAAGGGGPRRRTPQVPNPQPGLLALAARQRQRSLAARTELETHWMGDGVDELLTRVDGIADYLLTDASVR